MTTPPSSRLAWLAAPSFAHARGLLVANSFGWVGGIAAASYLMIAVNSLAGDGNLPSALVDLVLGGAFLTLCAMQRRASTRSPNANLTLGALLVGASFGAFATIVIDAATVSPTGFLILFIACGLLLLSWPAFIASSLAAAGAWLGAGLTTHQPLLVPFIETVLPGLGLGIIVHAIRMRTLAQTYDLHQRERERAEALQESEGRLRGLINSLPSTFAIVDREGHVDLIHKPGPADCSRPLAAIGFDELSTEDRRRLEGHVAIVFQERRVVSFEMASRGTDGSVEWYSVTAGPILMGRVVAKVVLLGTNITQRRQEAETFRQSEKLSGLGTLVAGVAHEINNPLMYMRGNLELNGQDIEALLVTLPDEATRETLRTMLTNEAIVLKGIDRIEHITQSLKRVARPRQGERTPEDVDLLVDSVLTVAASRILPGCKVETDYHATQMAAIDSSEISQVILNLLFNAIDAIGQKPRSTIRITTRDGPGLVIVEVADDGGGIPDDMSPHIFTPFKTTKPDGTGLGLSISHRIVEDHGGSLTFESEENVGTTFRMTLPIATPRVTP